MDLLTQDHLREARQLAGHLHRGDQLSQQDLNALRAEWEPRARPSQRECDEQFAIARPDGSTTGIAGPRWIFHLLGLRHRAVEVALSTPTGLIVLQRRSLTKPDWPGALDMAVAGHVPQKEDGGQIDFEEGAWKEISEEIGLPRQDAGTVLLEGGLTAVGAPYCCFEADWNRNPPFFDAEVRQIYAATLSGEGLARIRFADGEVAGIFLVGTDGAWQALREEAIASGLRYSLPRYLDWLEQRRSLPR